MLARVGFLYAVYTTQCRRHSLVVELHDLNVRGLRDGAVERAKVLPQLANVRGADDRGGDELPAVHPRQRQLRRSEANLCGVPGQLGGMLIDFGLYQLFFHSINC